MKFGDHCEVCKKAPLGLGKRNRVNIFRVGSLHGTVGEQRYTETDNDADDVGRVASRFAAKTIDELGVIGDAPPRMEKDPMRATLMSGE